MQYIDYRGLHDLAIDRVEDILDTFDINTDKVAEELIGSCPVHGGDCPNAFKLKLQTGRWACYTRSCHKGKNGDPKNSIVHLIQHLLSNQSNKQYTLSDAANWLKNFLNLADLPQETKESKKRREFSYLSQIFAPPQEPTVKLSPEIVKHRLNIPAQYFIKRKFAPWVLKKYDIGYCGTPYKPMFERVVVPIYDHKHEYVIAVTGRTIYPKCSNCNMWHNERSKCPRTHEEKHLCNKWRHSKGFHKSTFLYNSWFAAEEIRRTRKVFLVEGPGDCWKMVEAGIHNVCAIFGKDLSDFQISLIEKMGAVDIISVLDSDAAGMDGTDAIKNNSHLNRFFRLHFPALSQKDPGELTTNELQTELKDLIEV